MWLVFARCSARDNGGHDAADAVEDRNRRVVALCGEAPIEHDVAVEQRASSVNQRIVFVVAFHEHGVEAGDGTGAEGTGALDQAGQQSEDRGRVAFGGGRLAGGESDFALRHGKAGKRIDNQQHVLAAGAEIFGDSGGRQTGANAKQRILVGGGDHDNRTAAARFAERIEKLSDFASTLADQPEDGEVGAGVARHHADERALADSAAAKDADTLARVRRSGRRQWRECRSRAHRGSECVQGRAELRDRAQSARGKPEPADRRSDCQRHRARGPASSSLSRREGRRPQTTTWSP